MADIAYAIPEHVIRRRSYQIWEREGCRDGRDLEHWFRARSELEAEFQRHIQSGEIPVGSDFVYSWNHLG